LIDVILTVVLTRSKSGHGNSSNGTFNQLGIERWRIPGWNARRLVNVIQGIMSLVDLALILGGTHTRSVDLETGEVMVPDGSPVRAPCEQAGDSQDEAGLSTVHISPQVELYSGASYLKVTREGHKKQAEKGAGGKKGKKVKRGKISGFSRKSRKRMIQELSKIRRDSLPVMVTLTYPEAYSDNPKDWKNDLDNFLRRLARKFPRAAGVWKLEPQKRGAPHFHLLVWGAGYIELLLWVSRAWFQVVKSGDIRHLHAGTRVEMVKSLSGSRWYASKYLGKEVDGEGWQYPGRWWGIFQREKLPYGELVNVEVTQEKAVEFIRYMRRFARIRSRDYKSLTITCNPDFWVNRLL